MMMMTIIEEKRVDTDIDDSMQLWIVIVKKLHSYAIGLKQNIRYMPF